MPNSRTLQRLRQVLAEEGCDAFLAYSPANVSYTTGFHSYFVNEWWRMHGLVLGLVPGADSEHVGLLVSDFEATAAAAIPHLELTTYGLWAELRTARELREPSTPTVSRPAQFDQEELVARTRDLVASRGLDRSRIASDIQHWSHEFEDRVRLALPDVEWCDFTSQIYRVRAIKEPHEVDALRRATLLNELAIQQALATVGPDTTALSLRNHYDSAVSAIANQDERFSGMSDAWMLVSVGGTSKPSATPATSRLEAGALVKFDGGTTIDGYRSDAGRTFGYRHVTQEVATTYALLLSAHERMRAALTPGMKISEIFRLGEETVRAGGMPAYSRGHFGHSVGLDTYHEEPPFIARDADGVLEPGMVLAIETPLYGLDEGAIMIEDLVHITPDGFESLTTWTAELRIVNDGGELTLP